MLQFSMTEQAKHLEIAKASLKRLNGIWMKFPDFTHPDIDGFTSRLVVGITPTKLEYPPFFPGLKPSYVEIITKQNAGYQVPKDTYTDFDTGMTYLNDNLFQHSPIVLDEALSYQVSLSTFMKTEETKGVDFDADEKSISEAYLKMVSDTMPQLENLKLTKRGFMRTLYHVSGSATPEFIAFLPPRGGLHSPDIYNELNLIYPQAFATLTKSVGMRNGDLERFMSDLRKGNIHPEDLAGDTPEFNGNFLLMAHYMGDNPWPLFDAMMTKNTVEAERRLRGAISGNSSVSILRKLCESLVHDQQLMSQLKSLYDAADFMDEFRKFYKKGSDRVQ